MTGLDLLRTRKTRPARSAAAVELLESRCLLSAAPWTPPDLSSVDRPSYLPDSVLVSFQDAAGWSQRLPGMQIGSAVGLDAGLREVLLEGIHVETALKTLKQLPGIKYAEPNWILRKQGIPNDPQFSSLWGMQGDELTPVNRYGSQVNEVWNSSVAKPTGSHEVFVGIIDEGIDFRHPDLAANIWSNPFDPAGDANGDGNLDDDGNGYADDLHGWDFANGDNSIYDGSATDLATDEHGTHVAGTIGAVGDNGLGVAGVNWSVTMISGKFLNPGGGSITNAIKAIDYFTDLKQRHGLNIVALNNSWTGGGYSQAMQDAIDRAARQGILFIAAAGNGGSDAIGDFNDAVPTYPANYNTTAGAGYDSVISVAAIDSSGQLTSWSNYGAQSVDLGAPGAGVLSTTPGNAYLTYSGTSMAAPHVTGAAALYAANHPGATAASIRYALLDGAAATPTSSLATTTMTGGRLNIAATLGLDPDVTGPRVIQSSPSGSVIGAVSRIRVTFNEAIGEDATGLTFTPADIHSFTFTDLAGNAVPLLVDAVVPVAGSDHRQFDITFPRQTAHGEYRLILGPQILDRAANPMDQDRDGLPGEPGTSDQYLATFRIGTEIPSTDVPAPLGGFWSITASTLTIDQDVTIADLDVQLQIQHSNVGDLLVHLHDPSGKQVILSNRRGGTGDNFANTRFDDEAPTAIASGTAPFAGSYRPDEALSQLDGKNLRGTWTLYVENWGSVTGGVLNSWSLFVRGAGAPPTAAPDTYTTSEDTGLTVSSSAGLLANDTDPDGDPLTAVLGTGPSHGILSLNSNGSFTYTPHSNFHGTDSFTYRANDGASTSALATVTITVIAVADPPGAANDSYSTVSGTTLSISAPGVLANDSNPDGATLTAELVNTPAHGTLTFQTDGSFSYTPFSATFSGSDTFRYRVHGNGLTSNVATVSINVAPATKFYVVNDGSPDRTYEYGATGNAVENYAISSGNSGPRGIASTAAGSTLWVIDANRKVYVYNTAGGLLGSWSAGGLSQPQGITVHGEDVWIVDSQADRVYRYSNAASRTSGSQSASSNFRLASGNTNPKDLVTDGNYVYVVNDNTDKVFKYGLTGALLGSWTIDPANSAPTGITLDPVSPGHLWIVDSGKDRVYQYDSATGRTSGSQLASTSFPLAAGNTNPQGIADPPIPSTNVRPGPVVTNVLPPGMGGDLTTRWGEFRRFHGEHRVPSREAKAMLAAIGDRSWHPATPARRPTGSFSPHEYATATRTTETRLAGISTSREAPESWDAALTELWGIRDDQP